MRINLITENKLELYLLVQEVLRSSAAENATSRSAVSRSSR